MWDAGGLNAAHDTEATECHLLSGWQNGWPVALYCSQELSRGHLTEAHYEAEKTDLKWREKVACNNANRNKAFVCFRRQDSSERVHDKVFCCC